VSTKARRGQPLTSAEVAVLRAAAEGETAKEVALRTGRRPSTLERQRSTIIRKLGAVNMTNAVAIGYERGILAPLAGAVATAPLRVLMNDLRAAITRAEATRQEANDG
jgi:DNA-binding CsgD family transcriptional regulator